MAEDRRDDPDASPAAGLGYPDAAADPPAPDPRRLELAKLRAKVADLRRWCRELLDDPAAVGVLPADVIADLRAVEPAVSQDEANALYIGLARGGPIPPDHPAFRPGPGEPADPAAALAAVTAERERLRLAFYNLYDQAYPNDVPTEEEILRAMQEPSGPSISELIAEYERLYPE